MLVDGGVVDLASLSLTNDGGRGLTVTAAELSLSEVWISGCGDPGSDGGGIAQTGGSLDLDEVVLDGNAAREGGGLWLGEGTTLTAVDSTWSSNQSEERGGAIFAGEDVELATTRSTFEANTGAGAGCTVSLAGVEHYTSTDDTWVGNGAGAGACLGALIGLDEGSSLTMQGAWASSHDGEWGGCLYGLGTNVIDVSDSSFDGCRATEDGGFLYAGGSVELRLDGVVLDNGSAGGDGGGASLSAGGILTVVDSVFANHTSDTSETSVSTGNGGVFHVTGPAGAFFETSEFVLNQANSGGSIYATGAVSLYVTDSAFEDNQVNTVGGAVTIDGPDALAVFTGSSFTGGFADYGGALYVEDIEIPNTLQIVDSHFEDNGATRGGAVCTWDTDWVIIERTAFEGNGGMHGGALYTQGNDAMVDIRASRFCDNLAEEFGGATFLTGDMVTLTNVVVQENHSYGNGGGVYVYNVAAVDLTNNTFLGNSASDQGGALFTGTSLVRSVNDIFAESHEGNAVYSTVGSGSWTYGDWTGNAPANAAGSAVVDTTADGNLSEPPDFVDAAVDGLCDDDLHLSSTSVLVDAGTPELLDPDGSRSDMGAYGGPGADDLEGVGGGDTGSGDGGTEDGGAEDGGTEDGGAEDGGADGGTEDGGTSDGGADDGGTSDGGAGDGGADGASTDGGGDGGDEDDDKEKGCATAAGSASFVLALIPALLSRRPRRVRPRSAR